MSRSTVKMPYGFCSSLACELGARGTSLMLSDENHTCALCDVLAGGCRTRLIVGNCVSHEVLDVTCTSTGTLTVKRTPDPLKAGRRWPCGTKVWFEPTPELMLDAIRELQECEAERAACVDEDGKVNGLVSDTLDLKPEKGDPTCTRVELPDCEEFEFCVPGFRITWKDGCLTREVDCDTVIPDGRVTNATLTFKDSKIVRAESGDAMMGAYDGCCSGSCGADCEPAACDCELCTAAADPRAIPDETVQSLRPPAPVNW